MKTLLAFLGGVAMGATAAYYFAKKKYSTIADEEIDSIKRWYAKKYEQPKEQTVAEHSPDTNADDAEYDVQQRKQDLAATMDISERAGYVKYGAQTRERIMNGAPSMTPYVISPEEFGEDDEYTQITLTWYADGVLADDADHPVADIETVVGEDFWTHFGEYSNDSVYIRNDVRKCDYEILRNLSTFKEAHGMPIDTMEV